MDCSFNQSVANYNISLCENSENGTIDQDFIIPYNERPETYVVPVLFFLIFVIGVIGNGTLVIIFIKHEHMRNVPNTFIFSLAIADLLVILTSVPFTSIIYTMEDWPWGELICKMSETAKDLSVAVSVFTLTALSADRFFAIVDPLKKFHTGGGTKTATKITISIAVSIWAIAFLIAIPAAVGSHIKPIPDENNTQFLICYPFPTHWMNYTYPQVMVLFKFFILYLIPLFVIAIFYLGMAISLITSTHNMPGEIQGLKKQIKARKKVAVTVLIFVAVFAVCFAPLHIFMLFFYFYPDFQDWYNAFWHYLRITGFCLNYINYCANPIALYFLSGAFRKYFDQYLFCKKPRRLRQNTYPHQHTSISLFSVKRNQNDKQTSINCSTHDTQETQETTSALLGNNEVECSHSSKKIR
ncbi:neuropeptide CCHamide-1 receptor-like isoform X1 [Diorhabda carinulata]|uniref:neuropeptide CCHamide-1 receptor-like isoform X1 n=2 Tax=Diorhabda carinulata TaxID=1163345 RepID=UPI0025A1DF16|nr:neuropeptide CCHamide-1 receptor-like isoform X1 [Diorhabda carinulata]XP_057652483.1 neuropeptide CCHamide-1 receptor-like isoform X1 [Diorhabda carinulata]XP_057652484.1 neuropeptide CCHamide-1 receptor-like isoform X1 [Diorhabda carinulata]